MNLAKWLYRNRPPLVMIAFEGERYLVSMLRADVDWG